MLRFSVVTLRLHDLEDLIYKRAISEHFSDGAVNLALLESLPIRLTPMTATCWVPPLSRVKLGIGWSRGAARDAEQ